ncbi:DUF3888 domain-containing protein [Desulfosporosinus sp. FKA]|uniref:DUF3888 domain-containing protein n=1 Tax=Desulfosporosinus sp. FKA TaxID=1969834 RepID=UPI000B49DEF8|nr:DUF3888 domain-containing protein [Desulfosporosinus sp. FKA]
MRVKLLIAAFLVMMIILDGCANVQSASTNTNTPNTLTANVNRDGQSKNVTLPQGSAGNTDNELFREMLITAVDPYIQQSVTKYYKKDVLAPPYMVRVLEARKPSSDQVYEVSFEVKPYIGAHIEVGIDHVTLRVSPTKIEVVNFEHIKSFPLPSNL